MSKGKSKIFSEDVCSECGSSTIIRDEDSGELVCGCCGLVVKEVIINMSPEWKAFTFREHESRSRVGVPLSFSVHDKGLRTMIGRLGRDASGRKIPPETMNKMRRLRKWQIRSSVHHSVDRNLIQAMAELDRLGDKLHLTRANKEEAAVIYRKALEKDLVRGRSISAVATASLYAACRLTRTQRTLREVSRHNPINKKDIARCYRLLLRELKLQMPVPAAQLGVPKIAAKVGIGERTQQDAIDILREALCFSPQLSVTVTVSSYAPVSAYLWFRVNGKCCPKSKS